MTKQPGRCHYQHPLRLARGVQSFDCSDRLNGLAKTHVIGQQDRRDRGQGGNTSRLEGQ